LSALKHHKILSFENTDTPKGGNILSALKHHKILSFSKQEAETEYNAENTVPQSFGKETFAAASQKTLNRTEPTNIFYGKKIVSKVPNLVQATRENLEWLNSM